MDNKELLNFPCIFPIKIVGNNVETLIPQIIHIFQTNCHHFDNKKDMFIKYSKNNNYVSITANIIAYSKQQLDKLYLEFNQNKDVKITL